MRDALPDARRPGRGGAGGTAGFLPAAAAVLVGHGLAALVGGAVLAALLLRDPFWQGLPPHEVLVLVGGLALLVALLAAPGWVVLRLLVIRPLLRRGWPGAGALALFVGCEAVNAVAALLGFVAWNDARLGSNGGQALLGLAVFAVAGAAAGAAAWAGERIVLGRRGIGRAAA